MDTIPLRDHITIITGLKLQHNIEIQLMKETLKSSIESNNVALSEASLNLLNSNKALIRNTKIISTLRSKLRLNNRKRLA